jgi:hypothetical protein
MEGYAKDIALALLAGSIGLAGLLLVVSGLVLSQVNSLPADTTPDALLKRYRVAAKLGLIPFGLALIDAALCLLWLLHSSACLYKSAVDLFFLLLIITAIYGFVLLLKYL